MENPFQKAKVILQKLIENGFEAYFVGGSIRDFLQGIPIHDIDIATSATPEKVIAIFPKTFPIGIRHGTILVRHDDENYEVTTFRTESGYEDFRHPDQVTFETSIYKDLARRDFTINAMAMNINGEILDPYNGQKDLKNGLLRTVGVAQERFEEDPLRILRAVRFIAQLNLKADKDLQEAMKATASRITHLAIERIREEFTKLLSSERLDLGIDLLITTDLIRYLPYIDVKAENVYQVGYASFHDLQSDSERWALFLIVSGIHEPIEFLKSWRFSNKSYNETITLVRTFFEQRDIEWDKLSLYRTGLYVACSVERLKKALNMSSGDFEKIQNLWRSLPVKNRSELVVKGHDLCHWMDQNGGPWTGQMIEEIEKAVILGEIKNIREDIRRWIEHVN